MIGIPEPFWHPDADFSHMYVSHCAAKPALPNPNDMSLMDTAQDLQPLAHGALYLCRPTDEVSSWHMAVAVTMERKPLPPAVGEWLLETDE